jgi:hypothetical protein
MMRWELAAAFSAWLAASALGQVAAGQAADPAGSELDDVKAEVRALNKRLETVENERRADDGGEGGLHYDARPGWEKPDLWMWPAFRAEDTRRMRIGRAADIDLYMGLKTAGRFQYLTQKDVFIANKLQPDLDPSFQTAWGDLSFMADIEDGKMLVYADLYLSSRPHPSTTYGNEGYILVREMPDAVPATGWLNDTIFKIANVKVGHFEIDYGDHRYRRSDNAWVQRNLLIGNYLVDPDVEEIGAEVFTKPGGLVGGLIGVTSGTTTENFTEGRGLASVHGKLWVTPADDLRFSLSAYYVDHSDTGANGPSGRLYSARRSGGPYGGVWGGGDSPGDLTIGKDKLDTALQADVTFSPGPWEFYGNVGWVQDADPNGSDPGKPRERWMYGAVEGAYHFTPRVYAAARYSLAKADDIAGHDSSGRIHRIQVGGGYWLTRNVLAKAEYVYQVAQGFGSTDIVDGLNMDRDPSFNGLMLEMSFAF